MKRMLFLIALAWLALAPLPHAAPLHAEAAPAAAAATDWVSVDTISAVVRLGRVYDVYVVENLTRFSWDAAAARPDFGRATVVERQRMFLHVGSGVLVNAGGWMVSNAHVTDEEPQVEAKVDDRGNPQRGPRGRPLSVVAVPAYPGWMFVGIIDRDKLAANKRNLELKYAARVHFADADFASMERDRAVLRIEKAAVLDAAGVPSPGADVANLRLPFANLANPFGIDLLDNLVRSIGYPGNGDPAFPAITKGENLGFESTDRSTIKHTCFISGGNSGGGLFYRNALIGINTWDDQQNASRPVAVAQPLTYWAEAFAAVRLHVRDAALPTVDPAWIAADPSGEAYKRDVYLGFQVQDRSDPAARPADGQVVVFADSVDPRDLDGYFELEQLVKAVVGVKRLLAGLPADEVAQRTGLTVRQVEAIGAMGEDEFKSQLSDKQRRFYEAMGKGEFLVRSGAVEADGRALVAVPAGVKVKVLYRDAEGRSSDAQSYGVGPALEQGPLPVRVKLGR